MQIQGQPEHDKNFIEYLSKEHISESREFTFDLDKYRNQFPHSAQDIIKDPSKYYRAIKVYHQNNFSSGKANKYGAKVEHYDIKFEGNLGANFVTPRGLSSRLANQLVGLQGIITKIDLPKNYLEKSVHWCPKTKGFDNKQYPDSFNPENENDLKKTRYIMTVDQNKNPLEFEYGLSSFKNSSSAVIQELPQMAPPGLLPMSVTAILQNNLVGSVKPGDRVQMIGIYKIIATMNTKMGGIFKPYFVCMSVKPLSYVSPINRKLTTTTFPDSQVFDLFSRSIAPSIYGHEHMKKACLLMLVGGVEKELNGGMRLRGDINILMVGDPGTAKSQLLRWVLSTVDISIGTTGSGASGVGLTAAIVTDAVTGEKTLEAGAMVLADRGVVCIDEFDKMNENDRVAVHEVMEQQTVTIAKAGMLFSLNARCAVIAAANPIYGEYQSSLPPTKNIGMPDSLLSRFDLVFIVRDQKNGDRDKSIASKVCRNHRLAPQTNNFMQQYTQDYDYVINPIEQKKTDEGVYEKNNVYKSEGKLQILSQTYLKKYIAHIKIHCKPQMTDDSIQLAAQLWNLLRQKDFNERESAQIKVLPITIRSYESLIRLSTSHAKLRQSPTVDIKDIIQGFKLIVFCLYSRDDALNEELKAIMKSLDFDYEANVSDVKNRQPEQLKSENQSSKKQVKKSEDASLVKAAQVLSKLNIKEGSKQADQLLQMEVQGGKSKARQLVAFSQQERSFVYKKLGVMIKRQRGQKMGLQVSELFESIRTQVSEDKMYSILDSLQNENKLTVQNEKIYMSS